MLHAPARTKDLHDGRSLWSDSKGRSIRTRQASGDYDVEIAVVGGGISGSLCALELSAAGHEVLVADGRPPGEGSTIASTAMIQFELDVSFVELCEKIGRPKATRAYLRSAKAVADLSKLIERHGIDACWKDRDALYLAGDEIGCRGLQKEVQARQRIGLPSRYLTTGEIADQFGIDRTGAILSGGSAELDPARTAASCLRTAQRLGAVVLSPCKIIRAEAGDAGTTLTSEVGSSIKARKVVFATGYEVIKGLPRDAFEIISSWAIATQPLPLEQLWPTRCLIWEASDPYLYARTTADNRILAGGEDSKTSSPARRAASIPHKSKALLKKIQTLLNNPGLTVDYAWAGAFADSRTGLPIIKEIADLPGAMAVLGCGGNGITFSMIAAQIVRQWASGRRDRDSDLFQGL